MYTQRLYNLFVMCLISSQLCYYLGFNSLTHTYIYIHIDNPNMSVVKYDRYSPRMPWVFFSVESPRPVLASVPFATNDVLGDYDLWTWTKSSKVFHISRDSMYTHQLLETS